MEAGAIQLSLAWARHSPWCRSPAHSGSLIAAEERMARTWEAVHSGVVAPVRHKRWAEAMPAVGARRGATAVAALRTAEPATLFDVATVRTAEEVKREAQWVLLLMVVVGDQTESVRVVHSEEDKQLDDRSA